MTLLVEQLHFTRKEFQRALAGVTPEEATQRFDTLNCLSWMVGHLAEQEQRYWVVTQGKIIAPGLFDLVGSGQPASTPPLAEMWAAWEEITKAADAFLSTLTPEMLERHLTRDGKPVRENTGTMLLRNIYHYWYHLGESQAVRQLLGHTDLPSFVGDMSEYGFRSW